MSILINPGSRITEGRGEGWTNTYEGAIAARALGRSRRGGH